MSEITHVIFDLDGLIIDSEVLYTECTEKIVSRYGQTYEWSLKSRIMGRPPMECARIVVEHLSLPMTPEEFHKELYGMLQDMFPNARIMPGATRLIQYFNSQKIPTAIATGSARSSYEQKVSKKSELFEKMSHAVCSDDAGVTKGKPAPYIYQVAAANFKEPPKSASNVLVFEDAPNGVESAKAAGMCVVMVPDEKLEPEKRLQADTVLRSLEDFDPRTWGLPPLLNN